MTDDIMLQAFREKDYFTKIRRKLHKNPEASFCEVSTSQIIKDELIKYGVEIVDLDIKSGVLGVIRGEKEGCGEVIALRADIDALLIDEINELEYKSQNEGVMHACGHDGHAAMLLGAAKILTNNRDKFSGVIKFIFQPAEEIGQGAKTMIRQGVLDNPKVDKIIALHSWPDLEVGKIGFFEGAYYASADYFDVNIIGESGHGAYPHKTKDSLLAATHAVIGIQSIVTRQIKATENIVISVCRFNSGTANNIIPKVSNFGGTVRTHDKDIREDIPVKMEKIIKGISETFDCSYEFNYTSGMPMVINGPDTINRMKFAVKNYIGDEFIQDLGEAVMGSEDFGEYNMIVKNSAMFRIGNTLKGEETIHLHSDLFDFNDDAIPYGICALVGFVLSQ